MKAEEDRVVFVVSCSLFIQTHPLTQFLTLFLKKFFEKGRRSQGKTA